MKLKRNYLSIAMTLLVLLFVSCGDDDDVNEEDMAPPLSVGFTTASMFLEVSTTNTSENATAHAWDFGDGVGTSTEVSPSYTYQEEGTYTITLTSTGEGDQEDTFSSDVTVTREMISPTAAFSSEQDDLVVTFTDESVNAVSYAWDFGDGTGTSTEASPVYTYAEAGTYTVSLTVTSETDDTDTATTDITVEVAVALVAPTADFTYEATDLDVVFTDASVANDGNITAYSWDFGDTTGTSTDASPTYTYAAEGTYDVVLTITFDDIDGVTTATTTKSIEVTAAVALVAPTADFTYEATDLDVVFTDASVANDGNITAYSWDFGDTTGTSTDASPTYTYAAEGTYDVVLTITFDDIDGVTTATTTKSVTVTAPAGGGAGKAAVIRDTNDGDTGELRLNIDPLLSGRLEVTFTRDLDIADINTGSSKDAFIALLNSTGSTSSERSIIDLRIKDDEFEVRDQTFEVTSVVPTPGTLQTAVITWTAPDDATPPTVTVTIDGVAITDAPFTSGANAIGGVERVQFRLADNGAVLSNDATYTIDSMEVFSDMAGTTSIFATDFSEFAVGEVLDGTDDPFNGSSSEAVVEATE